MGFQSTTKTGLDTYKNGYIYTYKPWQPNTMDIVSSLQYWARVLQQKGCMFFNHHHIGILSQHIVEYPPMIGTPRWIDLIWSNTAFRCRFIHQNHGSFSLRSKENWENTRLHWAHLNNVLLSPKTWGSSSNPRLKRASNRKKPW